MKRLLADLLPPVALRALRRVRPAPVAIPAYRKIDAWTQPAEGWQGQSVVDAYAAVVRAEIGELARSMPARLPENAFGCALLTVANRAGFSMLDFGGAFGFYEHVARKLLPNIEIDYTCYDTPHLTAAASAMFPASRFVSDRAQLCPRYDFILASSSIQYFKDWQSELRFLADRSAQFLFVTRLPITNGPSFIAVQTALGTSYPGWNINRDDFLAASGKLGLCLIQEFEVSGEIEICGAAESPVQRGFLFRQTR